MKNNFSPVQTASVLDEVFREREKQDEKWGTQNHTIPEYLMILGEEVGEANKEALDVYFRNKKIDEMTVSDIEQGIPQKCKYENYRKELIQIAAVAVAMVECFDRNGK